MKKARKKPKGQVTLTGEELLAVQRKQMASQGKFQYARKYEIKSPLSMMWYNMNFEFVDTYPAKMNEDFARDMIIMYSNPDDIVWDGCCGSGTVARVANALGRIGYGTDQNKDSIELAQSEDTNFKERYWVHDSREPVTLAKKPKLILSSLPFGLNVIGDVNSYSNNPTDISNCYNYEQFFKEAKKIFQNYFDALDDMGVLVLDARDRLQEGMTIFLIFEFWKICKEIGFVEVCRGVYPMIPYRQMTYLDPKTKKVKMMVSQMDVVVFRKP